MMYEILEQLPPDSVVLDLGSGKGSYRSEDYPFRTIRVDSNLTNLRAAGTRVQASGEALPFASGAFDAIVMSHLLEHVEQPRRVLQEAGRVLKRGGGVFVAVPNCRSFSDRLYRRLFREGGGHISAFESTEGLIADVEWYLLTRHVGTRTLFSSFSFLNRRTYDDPASIRWIRIPPLAEPLVAGLTGVLAVVDRLLGARLSEYGWALYFGGAGTRVSTAPNRNVCVRCGAAEESAPQERRFLRYECSSCGATNVDRARIRGGEPGARVV